MAYTGECYTVLAVSGVAQHGSILTKSNAAHKRLHWYPNQSQGVGALAVKPASMRDLSRMTWSGYLSSANCSYIAGACALTGTPDFTTNLVGSISVLGMVYGGVGAEAYSTSACFGTRLRLSGRSGQLVRFSLDLNGYAATETTVASAGELTSDIFFPLELGTGGEDILGFEIDYQTGFFARFAPDGGLGYTGINESVKLRRLRARVFLAQGTTAMTEFGKYAGIEKAGYTLGLASPAGGSCTIQLGGYYDDWQRGEVGKISVAKAVLMGMYDGSAMISMN